MALQMILSIARSGLAATLLSGILQGTMLAPMKHLRQWQWENTWLAFAVFAYLLLPWIFAWATIPHLLAVFGASHCGVLFRTAVFGLGWGCAAVLFGLGIRAVGLGLGYAIILGLGTSVGSLVPLATLHRNQLWTGPGLGTMAGIALLILSVMLFALAGKKRETTLQESQGKAPDVDARSRGSGPRFVTGLIICILCGVLNPLLNFALAYGAEIQLNALRLGANPSSAANAIWVVVANAGFIPNLIYCSHLLNVKSTWRLFGKRRPAHWILVAGMGFMWICGTVLYGVGANRLGPLGPVIGWPLLMCSMVLTATFWGFYSGEWTGVRGCPIRLMALGLCLLVGAIVVLGASSRF
jgi:L-rhamnose-H+ transport protein